MDDLDYRVVAEATWTLGRRIREGRIEESDIRLLVNIEAFAPFEKLRRMASEALISACLQGHSEEVFKYHIEELTCESAIC